MILQGKKVNFLGDSITAGSGTSGEEHRFVNLIAKEYGLKEARNYGIGGTRIAKQPANSVNTFRTGDYCTRALEMDPDADAVVVFGGTNDFGHGEVPIGNFNDQDPYTFYGACHTLFRSLLIRYPGKPILVVTPLHRCNEDNPRGDGQRPFCTLPLSGYVNIIQEVAAFYALPVLDLFRTSGIQPIVPENRAALCPDGLHPNDAGNVILARRIAQALMQL